MEAGETFGPDRFRDVQAKLGLTNRGMAEALGCSTTLVEYLRNGKRPVTRRVQTTLFLLLKVKFGGAT